MARLDFSTYVGSRAARTSADRPGRALRTSSLRVVPLAFLLALATSRGAAGGEGSKRAEPPEENVSYVPSDDAALVRSLALADAATNAGDWPAAVRELQRVVEGPRAWVVQVGTAVGEPGLFEGASVVAHHRILALGAPALAAYEAEFGARARSLVEDGVARRDPSLLARAADLYLPSAAGRKAALLLADLALEAGDRDGALGWLDALEDLEEVASPALAEGTARARHARIVRLAAATASSLAAAARVRAYWESVPPVGDGSEAESPVPPPSSAGDFFRPSPPTEWTTAGGGPTRTAVPAPLPASLRLAAVGPVIEDDAADDVRSFEPEGESDGRGKGLRPSPWLPPRAVVSNGRVFVSDGRSVRVYRVDSQRWDAQPIELDPRAVSPARAGERGQKARDRWGWIEGFGLTVDGDVLYANVPAFVTDVTMRGKPDFDPSVDSSTDASSPRADRVVAIRIDDEGGKRLWTAGGGVQTPGLPEGIRLFGTPLPYRGAIHVAGLVARENKRFEAWHVALDPATGAARSATRLGEGGPIRRGRVDELMPASCAASHGRVYVVTSLGIASAVDARSGRTLWTYRYDRGTAGGVELGRRLDTQDWEPNDRPQSFVNGPPLVGGERVVFAPTDAHMIFALFDRPRGRMRRILSHKREHTDFQNFAVEQLVGIREDPGGGGLLVVVGQGAGENPLHDRYRCVAALDVRTLETRWERPLPFGESPEPFGQALLTHDEVFVPTVAGIARFGVERGEDRPPLEGGALARRLRPAEHVYGNLAPIPGRGLVAVNESYLSFWLPPK